MVVPYTATIFGDERKEKKTENQEVTRVAFA